MFFLVAAKQKPRRNVAFLFMKVFEMNIEFALVCIKAFAVTQTAKKQAKYIPPVFVKLLLL